MAQDDVRDDAGAPEGASTGGARRPVVLDCSVGEGGGGLLRASVPLAMLLRIPLTFQHFRAARSDPGLARAQQWLLDAICAWSGSQAPGAVLGATSFRFEPRAPASQPAPIVLDYDDPETTFEIANLQLQRNFERVTIDALSPASWALMAPQMAAGRAIRGQSIISPLIALIPCFLSAEVAAEIRATGGTETPAAPFADAFAAVFLAFLAQLGAALDMQVTRRGCLGIGGGGLILRKHAGRYVPRAYCQPAPADEVQLEARLYLYGSPAFLAEARPRAEAHLEALARRLQHPLAAWAIEEIEYPHARVQQLYLVRRGPLVRDVTVCHEEMPAPEQDLWGLDLACQRLGSEMQRSHLMSRFLVEQILPLLAAAPAASRLCTEHVTPHMQGVIDVVGRMTGRDIQVHALDDGAAEIVLTADALSRAGARPGP